MHTLLPHHRALRARSIRRRASTSGACPSRQIADRAARPQPRLRRAHVPAAGQRLQTISLGGDELVLLDASAASAGGADAGSRSRRSGRQTVIAHNDPSPARERVLRVYERRHAPINIQISLPSLDGIKRAVEMGLGVALLPRRCALTEIARGHLVAVKVPELGVAAAGAARVQEDRRAVARRGGVPGVRVRTEPTRPDSTEEQLRSVSADWRSP